MDTTATPTFPLTRSDAIRTIDALRSHADTIAARLGRTIIGDPSPGEDYKLAHARVDIAVAIRAHQLATEIELWQRSLPPTDAPHQP